MENNELKVIIEKMDVDWKEIKNMCLTTIGAKDTKKEPSDEWKKNLLICRHSPLRNSRIVIKLENVKFFVMGHLVRHHVGIEKFVLSSRTDRTGVPREERKQTDLVDMRIVCNVEALLNISERRLCMQADVDTIKVWKAVLEAIKEYDEDIYWACCPSCVRAGGCIEKFGDCKYFANFAKDLTKEELIDMTARYNRYNEYREKQKVLKR